MGAGRLRPKVLNRNAERIESVRKAKIRGPSGFGEMQAARMAFEQRPSKPLLERLDLVGNGGRSDAKFVRRFCKTLVPGRSLERPQCVERRHERARRLDGDRPNRIS